MVNGALHMFFDARDFVFEERDAFLELGYGQRIEVLFDQERDRVAWAREILFGIHDLNVDPGPGDVNNPGGFPTKGCEWTRYRP